MKTNLGKALSFFFSVVEGAAEALSTTSSALELMNYKKIKTSNFGPAIAAGALVGTIEFINSYFFQGEEIRKRLNDNPVVESDDEDEELEDALIEVSRKRKASYLTAKTLYTGSTIVLGYFTLCLLYSEAKAWVQDVRDGGDIPLEFISPEEGGLLLLYYALFDLPLICTAKIPQTCREIRHLFKISEHDAPDAIVMEKLFSLVRPIFSYQGVRKYIRITGSMSDTFEHVLPLVILIPTSWIRSLLKQPLAVSASVLSAISLPLLIVTATILAQTYLFEGKFSEENTQRLAKLYEMIKEKKWIPLWFSKIFHYLLLLGGLIHGIDTLVDVLLTLREFDAPKGVPESLAAVAFLTALLGYHYSEVKESQEGLQKITRGLTLDSELVKGGSRTLFFQVSKNYGSLESAPNMRPAESYRLN